MKALVAGLTLLTLANAWGARPVVIVSDCGNWVDDQLAIMELLASDQVEVKGIVASQYGAPGSAKQAYDSAQRLLAALGAKVPVWLGADTPLPDTHTPVESEGSKRLAALAEKEPIFVLCIAAATDVSSAILTPGTNVRNLNVFWLGGGPLPKGGRGDFDLANDINAARVLLRSSVPLTWMPAAGVADKLRMTGKELAERFGKYGAMGKVIDDLAERMGPSRGALWDLAAAVVFLKPGFGVTGSMRTPEINDAYQLVPGKTSKGVTIIKAISEEKILNDFERLLKDWAKARSDH